MPSFQYPQARLLVFAKAPVAGQVKTRLTPFISPEQAAILHQQLITRTLSTTVNSQLCPVQLWCSPSSQHPYFQHCQKIFAVELHEQQGKDLGERMAHAFALTLKQHDYALLVGTDCPSLDQQDFQHACELLQQGYDSVLAPAEDGGYTLIGLRTPAPELFTDIDWGTSRVLAETRVRLRQFNLSGYELPEQWDIDRPADLQRWQAISNPQTAAPSLDHLPPPLTDRDAE